MPPTGRALALSGYLLFVAVVLGVLEGATEFIPVSSTGHLIVAGDMLGYTGDQANLFAVFIQLGAILAIVWLYRRTVAGVLSTARRDERSRRFILNVVIATIPAVTRRGSRRPTSRRSGRSRGLSRTAATEFSFFLAIPIMLAASGYELLGTWAALTPTDLAMLAIGFLVSFVTSVVVVKLFLRFVSSHSFRFFAWYRIALGAVLIAYYGVR